MHRPDRIKSQIKRMLAGGAIIMALSGALGSAIGTRFTQRSEHSIIAVEGCTGQRTDARAGLNQILRRAVDKAISVDQAIAEIERVLRLGSLPPEIRQIVVKVVVLGTEDGIQEGIDRIAEAIEKTAEPLPTMIPQSPPSDSRSPPANPIRSVDPKKP